MYSNQVTRIGSICYVISLAMSLALCIYGLFANNTVAAILGGILTVLLLCVAVIDQ